MSRKLINFMHTGVVVATLAGCASDGTGGFDSGDHFTRALPAPPPPKEVVPAMAEPPMTRSNPAAREAKSRKKKTAAMLLEEALRDAQRDVTECVFRGARMICPWFDGHMYIAYLKRGEVSTIEFGPDEKIAHWQLSSEDFFTAKAAFGGSQEGERDILLVQAWLTGKRTKLTVLTDRREYQIVLVTNAKLYNPSVQFTYPEIEAGRLPMPRSVKRDKETGIPLQYLDTNYAATGHIGQLKGSDIAVMTDGKRTYIKFPPQNDTRPALFLETPDGGETPEYTPDEFANYWVKGVIQKAVLQVGSETIKIRRNH